MLKQNLARLGAVVGTLGAMSLVPAYAAIDVSNVVTEIEAIAAPAALIGSAVLIVIVGIKAFKWLRSAA